MKIEEHQVMHEVEDTYWWYMAMRSIFPLLPDGQYEAREDLRVLDAGCGTGAMLRHLGGYGQVIGLDISSEAIRLCTAARCGRLPSHPVLSHTVAFS